MNYITKVTNGPSHQSDEQSNSRRWRMIQGILQCWLTQVAILWWKSTQVTILQLSC